MMQLWSKALLMSGGGKPSKYLKVTPDTSGGREAVSNDYCYVKAGGWVANDAAAPSYVYDTGDSLRPSVLCYQGIYTSGAADLRFVMQRMASSTGVGFGGYVLLKNPLKIYGAVVTIAAANAHPLATNTTLVNRFVTSTNEKIDVLSPSGLSIPRECKKFKVDFSSPIVLSSYTLLSREETAYPCYYGLYVLTDEGTLKFEDIPGSLLY